jgi:hypothetical protein
MQQILWVDPNQPPQLNNLGPATQMGHSLREAVERATFKNVYPMRRPAAPAVREARAARRDALAAAAEVRAKNYV